LILRKIPDENRAVLGSFLRFQILRIVDKLAPAKNANFFYQLARRAEGLQSVDKALIQSTLEVWASNWLGLNADKDAKKDAGNEDKEPVTGNEDKEPVTGNEDKEPVTGNEDKEPSAGNEDKEPSAGNTGNGPIPRFIPLSIDNLLGMNNASLRADVLADYTKAFSAVLFLLADMGREELEAFIPVSELEYMNTRLTELNVNSVALSSKLARYVKKDREDKERREVKNAV
jgi:hypothetical protein